MTNPMEDLNTQLPGRLLAVESLLILLLGEHPNARKIFDAADAMLSASEAQTFRDGIANKAYALEMFAAARGNLDAIRENARRVRTQGSES
jgi:hypothetical protein